MLRLTQKDLDKIYAQAEAEYPAECCGILTVGPEGGISNLHPCTNIQDSLHEADPGKFPRDARIAYYIDSQELYSIVAAAEKGGGAVSGFFHSHIDCDAYFSGEDKERAMVWDEPAYADAVYPVISVYNGKVKGYKCFAWDDEKRDFVEVAIDVIG